MTKLCVDQSGLVNVGAKIDWLTISKDQERDFPIIPSKWYYSKINKKNFIKKAPGTKMNIIPFETYSECIIGCVHRIHSPGK